MEICVNSGPTKTLRDIPEQPFQSWSRIQPYPSCSPCDVTDISEEEGNNPQPRTNAYFADRPSSFRLLSSLSNTRSPQPVCGLNNYFRYCWRTPRSNAGGELGTYNSSKPQTQTNRVGRYPAEANLWAEHCDLPMHKSRQNPERPSIAWIYNPWLDLIVGCGAWSAPLLVISYASIASNVRAWAVAFYALALFFNYPHYMATIYRAYRRAEDFEKYRIVTVHTTALILLTLLLSHFWMGLLPWIFTIYITWSPWHYSGQNYGLFMMFARRAGASPDKATRQALYSAFVVSYLLLFLGFHTGHSNDPLFLSLGIPLRVSRWEQMVLAAGFAALSAYGLLNLLRQTGWRKLIPSLTLFSSQCLWFLVPVVLSLWKRIEVPQTGYSTGVLAVMHSAQYLWITSYYARREASGDDGKSDQS